MQVVPSYGGGSDNFAGQMGSGPVGDLIARSSTGLLGDDFLQRINAFKA